MRIVVIAACIFLFPMGGNMPLHAQEVEIVLSDDQSIRGSLEGFQGGNYRIRVDGNLRTIPEDDVITVTILERHSRPASGLEEIEAAFGEGRPGDAMKAIHRMLDRIPFTDREMRRLALEQHQIGISRLIKERNLKLLHEVLASSLTFLSTIEENGQLQALQREVDRRRTEFPTDSFNLDLAEAMAALIYRMAVLTPSAKASLPPILESLAELSRKKHKLTAAWKLYRALVRLDSSRARGLRDLRLKLALEDAREKMLSGDEEATVAASDEVLRLYPNHPGAFDIRETILFNRLQTNLTPPVSGEDRERLIHEFLRIAQKQENRDWATRQLKTETPPEKNDVLVIEQMRKYYPVRPGASWRYRVGKGNPEGSEPNQYNEMRIQEIEESENGRRVLAEIEFERGSSSTTRAVQIRIEGDSIFLRRGKGPNLKFPLKRGQWWDCGSFTSEKGTPNSVRKVTSDSRTVKTPYGTFNNCIEITHSSEYNEGGKFKRIETKEYYAPHVGLVKMEHMDPAYSQFNLELVDYRDR